MPDAPALWTLDELARRVDAALSVGYDGQASGRVRAVPDQRAIRYYTTLGLVDRPAARRASTALYGRRHLLQLVAIKKLQARGLPLARIQVELAGATDDQLERVAQLPERERSLTATAAGAGPPSPPTPFWKRMTAEIPGLNAAVAEPPSGAGPAGPAPGAGADELVAAGWARPLAWAATTVQGVRLAAGVTLLLDRDRPLRDDEVRAIQAAAEPLLEALGARGLGGGSGGREPR